MPQPSVLDLDAFNNAFDQFQQEQQGRHDATGTGERLAANVKEGLWNLQGAGAGLVGAKQARQEAIASQQASQLERGASADTTGEQIVGSAIQSAPMTVASFLPAGLARIPAARVAAGQVLAKAAARGMAVESAAVQRIATLAAQKAADQAARLGMAGSMGALSAPDAYDQAKQAGVSDDKALANAIAAAFTEGGVSLMFPKGVESAMLTRAPVTGVRQALTQGAKSLAHGAVDEGIEEGVTEAAHVAHEQALGVNNQPLFSDQNLSRVGEAAAAGGLMGPAFEGMGTAQDLAGAIRDVMRQNAQERSAMEQATRMAALSPDNATIAPAPVQATLPMIPPGPLPQDFTPAPMPAAPAPVEPGPGGYPETQPGGMTAGDSAAQIAQAFASLPQETQQQVVQGLAGLFQPPTQAAQEVPRAETIPPAPAPVAPGPVPGVAPAPAGAPAAPAPVARQQAPAAQPAPVAGAPTASPSASAVAGGYPVGTRVRFTRGAKKGTEATVAGVTADGRPVLRTDDGKALGGKFGITPENLEVVHDRGTGGPGIGSATVPQSGDQVATGQGTMGTPPESGRPANRAPVDQAIPGDRASSPVSAPAPVAPPPAVALKTTDEIAAEARRRFQEKRQARQQPAMVPQETPADESPMQFASRVGAESKNQGTAKDAEVVARLVNRFGMTRDDAEDVKDRALYGMSFKKARIEITRDGVKAVPVQADDAKAKALDDARAALERLGKQLGGAAAPGNLSSTSQQAGAQDDAAFTAIEALYRAGLTDFRAMMEQVKAFGLPFASSTEFHGALEDAYDAFQESANLPARGSATASSVLAPAPAPQQSAPAPVPAPAGDKTARTVAAADAIAAALDDQNGNTRLDWRRLFALADNAFGGTQGQGAYTAQDAYEALQLAINKLVVKYAKETNPTASDPAAALQWLDMLEEDIPSQTVRTGEQQTHQQFSTPPSYSFVANWTANLRPGEVYLEPNEGTGSLSSFGIAAGARVIGNELSERRAKLAEAVGPHLAVLTENTDHLAAILAKRTDLPKPSVVVMNPPFSATAGRTDKKDLLTGARHITEAIKSLAPGGRLVAIVGEGMGFDSPTYAPWWKATRAAYTVRANVAVDGKIYQKFGTNFGTRLLVIDKPAQGQAPATVAPVEGSVASLPELARILADVRQSRQAGQPEPSSAQPGGGGGVESGARAAGLGQPARPDAGPVGAGAGRDADQPGSPAGSTRPDGAGGDAGRAAPQAADRDAAPRRDGAVAGAERPGAPGAEGGSPAGAGRAGGRAGADALRVDQAATAPIEEQGDTYATYRPAVTIPGAKPHPADLVESQAMASVQAPPTTYRPSVPQEVITGGKLSAAQAEQVIRAGQAHQELLPDGRRQGYFIGDGTGVGKGRTISGVILDNWNQGRKRAVWVSKNGKLFADAQRDWTGLGGKADDLFNMKSVKGGKTIDRSQGIAFITYATLRQGSNAQAMAAKGQKAANELDLSGRVKQLAEWLGKDFDGVIAFDEAHGMGNAVEVKGKRGKKEPSAQALAGVLLQKALPKSRILYVSATGATEVANLSYADRLGLWGDGTPFANVGDFINKISGAGIAAMEMIARDLKAMGKYLARSISFQGVKYDRVTQDLTSDQVEIYNELAKAWQVVLGDIRTALETTKGNKNANAKSAAYAAFWSAHQRFFNQTLTGMQMPAVIRAIEEDLAAGRAPVIQLVNTNEAALKRALSARAADAGEEDESDLEDLDLTPRDMVKQMVRNSFPTIQHQEVTDEKGNTRSEPVRDSQGNFVENPDAVAMRDRLLANLDAIRTPDGPLEQLLAAFGPDQVAEVTGRTVRLVPKKQKDGTFKTVQESRSEAKARAEAKDFQDDKRKILVFSDAGGTGQSYHADRGAKNQRIRRHYVLQPGWRADNALQGLGRTHRTNQAQPPEFVLVSTNLKAQKRFISSIARRLDQLGALTKGQRQAGSGGLFSAADNLESIYAEQAMEAFIRDLRMNHVTSQEFEEQTGLRITDPKTGRPEVPEIPQFLNRMLSLSTDMQDRVFDAFQGRLEKIVQQAAEDGTLDAGLETLKADKIEETSSRTVHTDERTGATTTYHVLKVSHRFHPTTWDEAMQMAKRSADAGTTPFARRNAKSGRVYLFAQSGIMTLPSGQVVPSFRRYSMTQGPAGRVAIADVRNLEAIGDQEASRAWADEVAKAPEFRTETQHLVGGALLPVWDRLPDGLTRVVRARLDDGRSILGRVIPEEHVADMLKHMGVEDQAAKQSPEGVLRAILDGQTATLANGWKLERVRAGGENRIELTGKASSRELDTWRSSLERQGVIAEYRQFKWRYFIPSDPATGAQVLERVTEGKPITRLSQGASELSSTDQAAGDAIPEADRAAAFGMDEPTTEEAPAELAAPTDQAARSFNGTNYRVPAAPLPPEPGKPVQKLADIILDFGKALTSAGLGQTEFTNAGLRSDQRGVYKPATGQTAIRHNNLDAAAHEIAHRLDDFFPFTKRPEQDAPASEVRQWKKAMKELMPFSYTGSVPPPGLSREGKNAYIRAEGFAEFVRALIVNPEETQQRAPTAYAMLRERVPAPVMDAVRSYSDRVRRFVGLSNAEKTQANVRGIEEASGEAAKAGPGRMSRLRQAIGEVLAWAAGRGTSGRKSDIPDFQAPIMDRVKFGWFDSLWPAVKAYRQALDIQGIDQSRVPIDRDYETLARIGAGLADRMDSMFIDGLVDAENAPRIDPKTGDRMNLEWLIGPAIDAGLTPAQVAAELDAAMAQGVEERTVEEGKRNLWKAQQEALAFRQALFDANPDDPDIGKKYLAFLKQKVRQARETNSKLTGIAGGLDSDYEQARRALRERRESDPESNARRGEILRRYRAWANATLDYAVQAGVLGEDRAESLKKSHQAYIDLHRVIEHETAAIPMKAFKGSSRLIDNPLVNLLHATWSTIQWADRNRVRRAFVDALSADRGLHQGEVKDLATIGHEITEDDLTHRDDAGKVNGRRPYKVWVPAGKDEHGKNTVKASWWVFDPAVEASFEAAHAFDNPTALDELLTGIKRLSQRAITAAPPFLIRQVYRDTVSRLVTTEAGSGIGDLFKGYGKVGGKPVMERYKTSGAGQAGWDDRGKEAYQRRLMGVLYDAVHDPNRVVATIKSLGQGYMHLAHESDLLNRRAEFVRAWQEAKKQGMTDFQADLYAAKHARGLMDFAVAGYYAKKINRFVVFFNAGMQALRRAARAMSADHLPTTALRWGLYVGMPTALIYALQAALMDDKDREEWRQRPAEKRDFAWSFKLAPNLWLDVPKPYEWGVMASAIERTLDEASGHPHSWDGYPMSLYTAVVPFKPEMMAGSMRPFLEAAFNHSVFTGRPIVPYHEANADLDLRKGTANASELGQLLQKAMGVDARKIDFLIQSVFGGFGRIATARSSDPGWWAGATSGMTGRSPAWEAKDVQWVMDFAEARKVASKKPFELLRNKLMAATKAEDGATRDRLAREAREYATKLRGAIEKNPKAFNGPK